VGKCTMSSNTLTLFDDANYGNVVSQCAQDSGSSCGLVCTPQGTIVSINNCVNQGSIEGASSYGISNSVANANNVVNLGKVTGGKESFAFWKTATSYNLTSLYGKDGICTNCSSNVTLIKKNTTDGHYHHKNKKSVIVDSSLNEECRKKKYTLRWDYNLKLRRFATLRISSPVNENIEVLEGLTLEKSGFPEEVLKYHLVRKGVDPAPSKEYKNSSVFKLTDYVIDIVPYYLVTIYGEINKSVYAKADGEFLGNFSNELLKEYFESDDFIVGDSKRKQQFKVDDVITEDLSIVVMKNNVVSFDMEEGAVNSSELYYPDLAESIYLLTGLNESFVVIEAEIDPEGYVVRVMVFLNDNDSCLALESAVYNISKENCTYGAFCHALPPPVTVGSLSLFSVEGSVRADIEHVTFVVSLSFILTVVAMMKWY